MEFAFPITRILPVQRTVLHYFSALDLGINVRLSAHFTGGAGLANPQTRVFPGVPAPLLQHQGLCSHAHLSLWKLQHPTQHNQPPR